MAGDASGTADDLLGNRLEFETLIADISASLLAAPPDRLLPGVQAALDRVREFFHADRCALLAASADGAVVKVRWGSFARDVSQVSTDLNLAPMFPWAWQQLIVDRVPVRVPRIDDLPPDAEVERASWQQMPIRSALALPIETAGDVRHLIVLQTVHDERDWPAGFVPRLRVLGQLLVGALQRQTLIDGLQVSQARLASAADLVGLGFYEVDFVERTMYTDARLRGLCGMPPDMGEGLEALAFWAAHLHAADRPHILEQREQLHEGTVDRLNTEYRYLHPTLGERWIQHQGRVARRNADGAAVLTCGVLRDITERRRGEDDLRELSRRLIQAHEEERALLARELHDDVTQRLAVLAIDLGRAEREAIDEAEIGRLRAAREDVVRLSEDIHGLAYQLHPSVLVELGLVEALRTECERRNRQRRIAVVADLAPLQGAVPRDAALALFRIAQEALNNVTRHAAARTASLRLRQMTGGVLLAVQDDGVGFEVNAPGRLRSLGLASMRERIRLVHGTLDIESAPGHGTTVIAWVPLEGADG
jgi:signal transduction histidine kinase